jgi:hypothetical protein
MALSVGRLAAAVIGGVVVMAALISGPMLFENLDAADIMVVQSPIAGDLTVHTEPGWKWQGFGTVTIYPRRKEYKFTPEKDTPDGLSVRFYDGGHATLFGSVSWQMPLDHKSILQIHKEFRSTAGVESQAIRRSMETAVYFSGPTMSSLESAAGRRTELLSIVNDQMLNGVYKTIAKTVEITEAGTNNKRQVTATEIVMGANGQPVRAQESYVKALPLTVSQMKYDDAVEKQIRDQQQATNAVQVAIANAKKAVQDTLTTEEQGKAAAAKAKWEQEVINAKVIAEAQQKITVADASVKEAEAFKRAETLRGEGEAARKRLVMEADGALDKKLEAIVAINERYAQAIEKAQPGAWVPSVQMGGGGATAGQSSTALVDLMTAKTARDLGIDLSVKGTAQTKK